MNELIASGRMTGDLDRNHLPAALQIEQFDQFLRQGVFLRGAIQNEKRSTSFRGNAVVECR